MKDNIDDFKDIINEKFYGEYPKDYANKLKKKFSKDITLWYDKITPTVKADELFVTTGGDYSKIWDTHCECCFKPIDKNTKELCFISEDELTWLCKDCYEKVIAKKK